MESSGYMKGIFKMNGTNKLFEALSKHSQMQEQRDD